MGQQNNKRQNGTARRRVTNRDWRLRHAVPDDKAAVSSADRPLDFGTPPPPEPAVLKPKKTLEWVYYESVGGTAYQAPEGVPCITEVLGRDGWKPYHGDGVRAYCESSKSEHQHDDES